MPDDTVTTSAGCTVHLLALDATLGATLEPMLPPGLTLAPSTGDQVPTVTTGPTSTLLLIDCQSITWTQTIKLLQEIQQQIPRVHVALWSVAESQPVKDALRWPVLSGIFSRSMETALLRKGLQELQAGRFWFSREQMNLLAGLRQTPRASTNKPAEALSPRELEVLGLTSQGKSNADIANELFLSQHTVKTHLYNLYRKLGVVNRTQAVHWYQENQ